MSAIVANCAINLNCELTQPVKVQYLDGNLFRMDNAGNTAHVYVYYNGQPQEIVGSVSADVIRADGSTVAVTGAMSGNRVYVIFPQSVYAVPGVLSVVIKVTEGTTTTTIAAFVANVYQSSTDTVVDPGTIIPSVDALISAIQTAVASIPSDYSALLATIATDYSPSKPYPNVGSYAWYGGVLKRSIVPITTAETYDSSHWTNAILCDDVSALKSALPSIANSFYTIIPDNTDYNTLLTPGTYLCTSSTKAQGMTNKPSDLSYAHKMFVMTTTAENRLYQLIFVNNTASTCYKRFYNGSWSAWKKSATVDEIPTAKVNELDTSTPSISNARYTIISNGTDYNTVTTPGTYLVLTANNAQTMINCGATYAHKMFVVTTTGSDILIQYIIENANPVRCYIRYCRQGTWQSWHRFMYMDDAGDAPLKILVIGDSYSEQARWTGALSSYLNVESMVNLGVTSASLKDKYQNRTTYPYTSRPVKTNTSGNLNTFMCQIEKLKRLMTGTDLDEGETAIYQTEADYPNVIIIEGGQNDAPDADTTDYIDQFMTLQSNVYVAKTSSDEASLGSVWVKTPNESAKRTCFAGAYRSLVEELQTLFPKAQIFATSRTLLNYWSGTGEIFPKVLTIKEQQKQCCAMCGIDFIDWQTGTQINSMRNYPKGSGTAEDPYCYGEVAGTANTKDTYDLLHPSNLGAKKYAKVVANAIRSHFLEMDKM